MLEKIIGFVPNETFKYQDEGNRLRLVYGDTVHLVPHYIPEEHAKELESQELGRTIVVKRRRNDRNR